LNCCSGLCVELKCKLWSSHTNSHTKRNFFPAQTFRTHCKWSYLATDPFNKKPLCRLLAALLRSGVDRLNAKKGSIQISNLYIKILTRFCTYPLFIYKFCMWMTTNLAFQLKDQNQESVHFQGYNIFWIDILFVLEFFLYFF